MHASADGKIFYCDMVTLDVYFQLEKYDEDDFIPQTEPKKRLASHNGGVYKLALHPQNCEVVASCSVDCVIKAQWIILPLSFS